MTTPKRATGVRVAADKIAAARLRVKVGELLNDPAPDWVRRLAEHDPKGQPMNANMPEEGALYYIRSRYNERDPELAQFRAGEFLRFGTDDNAYPEEVWVIMKVAAVEA